MKRLFSILLSLLLVVLNSQSLLHAQDLSSLTITKTQSGMNVHLYQIASIDNDQYSYTKEFSDAKNTSIDLNNLKTSENLALAAQTLKGYAANVKGNDLKTDGESLTFSSLSKGLYLLLVDDYTSGNTTYTYLPYLIAIPQTTQVELSKYSTTEIHKYSLVKHWVNSTNTPDSILVDLYNGSTLEKTITLSSSNNYSYSWTTDTTKNYSIKEHEVAGYSASVASSESDGTMYFVLTNTKNTTTTTENNGNTPNYNTPNNNTTKTTTGKKTTTTSNNGKDNTPTYKTKTTTPTKATTSTTGDHGSGTTNTYANKRVKTGDETHIAIYVILMATAGVLLILVGRFMRND